MKTRHSKGDDLKKVCSNQTSKFFLILLRARLMNYFEEQALYQGWRWWWWAQLILQSLRHYASCLIVAQDPTISVKIGTMPEPLKLSVRSTERVWTSRGLHREQRGEGTVLSSLALAKDMRTWRVRKTWRCRNGWKSERGRVWLSELSV